MGCGVPGPLDVLVDVSHVETCPNAFTILLRSENHNTAPICRFVSHTLYDV